MLVHLLAIGASLNEPHIVVSSIAGALDMYVRRMCKVIHAAMAQREERLERDRVRRRERREVETSTEREQRLHRFTFCACGSHIVWVRTELGERDTAHTNFT